MLPGPQAQGCPSQRPTDTLGRDTTMAALTSTLNANSAPLPAALLCLLSHQVTSPQSNYIPTDTISSVPWPLRDAKLKTLLGSSLNQGKPSFMAELRAWRLNSCCCSHQRFSFRQGGEKGCHSHPPATLGPRRQETLVNAGSGILAACWQVHQAPCWGTPPQLLMADTHPQCQAAAHLQCWQSL